MKAYQLFAKALVDQGGTTLFGLMGDANMQIIAHYKDVLGGRYFGATHEAGAVMMADGYSRISGEITFATVTHGPGFTNAVTAITEAGRNHSEILIITGDTPPERTWTQALDIAAVVAPTGAGYERVYRPDSIAVDLARAVHRVKTEHRPVVLNFPYQMMQQVVEDQPIKPTPSISYRPPRPDEQALERALDVIAGAKRPVILAGRGAARSGARDEIVALADLLGAPLATSLLGKGLFAGHPLNLGVMGSLSTPIGSEAVANSDCIISFGAGLNRYTSDKGDLFAGKRIVQVDIDPHDVGIFTRVDEVLIGDAKEVAALLTQTLSEAEFEGTSWGKRYEERLEQWTPESDYVDQSGNGTIDVRTAVIEIDRVLPKDRNVVSDVGRFLVAAWRYFNVPVPTQFIHTSTFGAIGLGLGAGIGAALVDQSRLTVAVMGDGGFMMTAGEFSTAVRHRIPMVVVVLNDGAYGAEYTKLKNHGESPVHSFVDWPELGVLAEAMGGRSHVVRSRMDIEAIPELITDLDGPILIDVRLDPDADVGHW